MNIVIQRTLFKGESINGSLFIEGQKICDTAENVLNSLPAGDYEIHPIKCHQYARKMPLLFVTQAYVDPPCKQCKHIRHATSNCTLSIACPMLKPGNGIHNRTDSSILLGTYICPGCLKHSRPIFNLIYERIRKAITRHHAVTLEIRDNT